MCLREERSPQGREACGQFALRRADRLLHVDAAGWRGADAHARDRPRPVGRWPGLRMVTKSAQAEQAEAMKKKPAAPDWLAALKSIQDGPMTTPLWPMTIKTGRHLPGEIDMVDPYPVVETCVDYN